MTQLFPKWTNLLPHAFLAGFLGFTFLLVGGMWYYATPNFFDVGYMPDQPISYSHQIHVSKLGMDCRYCHTHVTESKSANIPSASTCMSCHTVVDEMQGYLQLAQTQDGSTPSPHWRNPELAKLREYYASDESIPWVRIHKLPDFVHFNHAVHINAGVSCYSCHKRIDEMPVVFQAESLSMGFCLECHRAPEHELVGKERVTDLEWVAGQLASPDHAQTLGARLAARLHETPPQHCGACHY